MLGSHAPCDEPGTHGLQHEQREEGRGEGHAGGEVEHDLPVAGIGLDRQEDREQQRRGPLRRVEQARIGGRVLVPERVGAGRREQRVDLAPGEEHEAGQQHEGHRDVGEHAECEDAEAFDQEGDDHRVLAADMVGDPSEEWPGHAVQDTVDGQREGQGRQGQAHQRHRHAGDVEVLGDGRERGRRHQAAAGHHDEHEVEHPEHRRPNHLLGRILAAGGGVHDGLAGEHPVLEAQGRSDEQQRGEHHDDALADAEHEEGVLETALLDHVGDRDDGQRRTGTEPGGRQAGREPAPVGKPLQGVADAGAVDRARTDAADGRGRVEVPEGIRVGVHHPADPAQEAAEHRDDPRAVAIHEPALNGNEPGLGEDEDREGPLDRGALPAELLLDRIDEQRPAILQVGDHRHAEHAEKELPPSSERRAIGLVEYGSGNGIIATDGHACGHGRFPHVSWPLAASDSLVCHIPTTSDARLAIRACGNFIPQKPQDGFKK